MKTDGELLREFVNRGDKDAFRQLVQRHVNVVYSAARREMADDLPASRLVTQLVFAQLARKAGSLRQRSTLAGWLYTSVRDVIAKERRQNPNAQRLQKPCRGD